MTDGILLELPGKPPKKLQTLLLDFTGTLSFDGQLLPGVAERLTTLSTKLKIIVLTADTFGTAQKALYNLPIDIKIIKNGQDKADIVNSLKPGTIIAIGNGFNDIEMLRLAELGIAVIGPEGCASGTLTAARVVCRNILEALDLLTNPLRLKATLRD